MNGPKARFNIYDEKGKRLFDGAAGGEIDYVRDVVSPPNSKRVAFAFGHISGSRGVEGVVVFDATQLKIILSLKLTEKPMRDKSSESWAGPVIALSPDARKIAVLVGQELQLFDINR
jgi:hypothetical protein